MIQNLQGCLIVTKARCHVGRRNTVQQRLSIPRSAIQEGNRQPDGTTYVCFSKALYTRLISHSLFTMYVNLQGLSDASLLFKRSGLQRRNDLASEIMSGSGRIMKRQVKRARSEGSSQNHTRAVTAFPITTIRNFHEDGAQDGGGAPCKGATSRVQCLSGPDLGDRACVETNLCVEFPCLC